MKPWHFASADTVSIVLGNVHDVAVWEDTWAEKQEMGGGGLLHTPEMLQNCLCVSRLPIFLLFPRYNDARVYQQANKVPLKQYK